MRNAGLEGIICISEVIDIFPGNLDSSLCFFSPAFLMMYSAYKLNKQGDNLQPWRTPFPIWNQSVVPCPVLTVASWPDTGYSGGRSGGLVSPSLLEFSTVYCDPHKGFGIVNKTQIGVFLGEDNGTPLQYSCLEIPWTEEPGTLQSMGSLRVRHDWVTSLSLFTFMHWRRKWQPTPVFLPGESQGRGAW